jgi:hypothetical protein
MNSRPPFEWWSFFIEKVLQNQGLEMHNIIGDSLRIAHEKLNMTQCQAA